MSDNDDSSHSGSSSDESQDVEVTGLVATRAKRVNAGNLYAAQLGDFDDPNIQALFAEEDDDEEDYESSNRGGDDEDAMESSSEDDAGPPVDGEPEDLTGEKELKRAERAEQTRKRKADKAKLVVPTWAKKVKIAEQVQHNDGSSSAIEVPIVKKKGGRRDWKDLGDVGPSRQSVRASAVAFRDTVHDNLKESAARSHRHKTALKETMKRERAARRVDLSVEARIEKCRRIEKETTNELGRFEREEAERVRIREEALLAKRRRVLDGPLLRTLSTSGLFVDGKLKVQRLLHGSQSIEEIQVDEENPERDISAQPIADDPAAKTTLDGITPTLPTDNTQSQAATPVPPDGERKDDDNADTQPKRPDSGEQLAIIDLKPHLPEFPAASDIETKPADVGTKPHLKECSAEVDDNTGLHGNSETKSIEAKQMDLVAPPVALLSGTHEHATNPDTTAANATVELGQETALVATAPNIREQALRSLLILEDFPSLENAGRRLKGTSVLEPTAVAQILIPESYPSFTDEEAAYLRKVRKLKQELHPKALCALTSWDAKYRDPKTGIVYADVAAYKMIQRMIAGGCKWNNMLECWSAPFVGMIGRPAHGVPAGFDRPAAAAAAAATMTTTTT